MATKKQFSYAIGDRVAERPKTHALMTVRAEVRERIAQYRSQRYGTVVDFKIKVNARGANTKFLVIQWDHLKTPTDHAQMRICPVEHLDQLTKEVIVPGE